VEARWEAALRELKHAEEAAVQANHLVVVPFALTAELNSAFPAIGQKLPQIWDQNLLAREQKKALLRCLVEKIALHRVARDHVQARIVWAGGETTPVPIPVQVGSFASLSTATEMENLIVKLASEGLPNEAIAEQLTAPGHRSPMRQLVLPSTVKTIRLKHGILQKRTQSHPRRIDGYLTVPQLAKTLDLSVHYGYDRIHNGTIEVAKDEATGLYLFPNQPATIKRFRRLLAGRLQHLRFSKEHQHA
jgi:hypothetical protein